MTSQNNILQIFQRHLPEHAIQWCFQLWQQYRFNFIITKKRMSKMGDYRYVPSQKSHTITLNNDLNKYAFLVTYIHEVAHLKATVSFGLKIKPHGHEWKQAFQELLMPVLQEKIIPAPILTPLKDYISDPKASSCTDVFLHKALRMYDAASNEIYLSEINIGDHFQFNKRLFIKQETKRSRALCKDLGSGKKYLIAEAALIKPVGQTSLNFSPV